MDAPVTSIFLSVTPINSIIAVLGCASSKSTLEKLNSIFFSLAISKELRILSSSGLKPIIPAIKALSVP